MRTFISASVLTFKSGAVSFRSSVQSADRSRRLKTRNDILRNRRRSNDGRIAWIADRPDAALDAFHDYCAVDRETMLDIETRSPESADPRCHVHDVAEARLGDEARAGIDKRDSDNAVAAGEVLRLHAQCGFEKQPRALIEELKKAKK